jgi:nitrogen-specific signal transduction histidine kinase
MGESYSSEAGSGSAADTAQAHELLTRLLPDADVPLLVAGLLADAARPSSSSEATLLDDADIEPSDRELRRIRRQLALGKAARSVLHDLNNPLTALVAEVQLLEMEAVAPEQRAAARRIVELARRVAAVARRLDVPQGPVIG